MIECLLSLLQRPHVHTNDNFGSAAKIRQNLSDDNFQAVTTFGSSLFIYVQILVSNSN